MTSLIQYNSNKHVVRHEFSRKRETIVYINNVEAKCLYKALGDVLLWIEKVKKVLTYALYTFDINNKK